MTEEELWKKFNKSKATILGALLNGVSTAIKRKDKIRLESHPRMADFMHWISAAEPAIFKKDGQFRKAFEMNRNNLGHACMENDPVAMAIRILLDCNDGEWVGNPTDLLYALQDALPDTEKAIIKTKLWPRAANALSLRIGEIESVLHWVGIEVSLRRKSNERRITLKKVNQNSD
jgi:hypothetical protein